MRRAIGKDTVGSERRSRSLHVVQRSATWPTMIINVWSSISGVQSLDSTAWTAVEVEERRHRGPQRKQWMTNGWGRVLERGFISGAISGAHGVVGPEMTPRVFAGAKSTGIRVPEIFSLLPAIYIQLGCGFRADSPPSVPAHHHQRQL